MALFLVPVRTPANAVLPMATQSAAVPPAKLLRDEVPIPMQSFMAPVPFCIAFPPIAIQFCGTATANIASEPMATLLDVVVTVWPAEAPMKQLIAPLVMEKPAATPMHKLLPPVVKAGRQLKPVPRFPLPV